MSERFDCSDPAQRDAGVRAAVSVIGEGGLVVLPTDTVYGIGADAFTPSAVLALLAAKGRSRVLPVPVLVGSARTLDGLVDEVPELARALVEAFWPGGLTLVLRHTSSLVWDLGETRGTVAVRMPAQPVALDLLAQTGPLAVSSANRTGLAPPTGLDDALAQLGDAVAVYLDDGPTGEAVASTIVDLTSDVPRLLRDGAVSVDQLRTILPNLDTGL
ncbi:MAG: L-threonylcarbamoyladenylate synthase [Mycobacteriales bacterium]